MHEQDDLDPPSEATEAKARRNLIPRRARNVLTDLPEFLLYVFRRFLEDGGLRTSASLTYTSLLGLVPILAVFLAVLSGFPAFAEFREDVKDMILGMFAPSAEWTVQEHLEKFLENTRNLGFAGAAGIAITSLLMLNTIEQTLNGVWRVREVRPIRSRLMIFWAIMTLPPFLVVASLSISSYFFAIADSVDVFGLADILKRLTPLLMQAAAFTILFIATPYRRVRVRDALAGGAVSSVLFEILKNIFGFYVAVAAEGQQAIYGALAAIPLFLLWIYASWTIVLIGAEVAASLPEWRGVLAARQQGRLTSGERLATAVGILAFLWRRTERGEDVEREEIEAALPAEGFEIGIVLERLIDRGYIVIADTGRLVLGRDLAEATLYRPQADLGLALEERESFRNALERYAPALAAPMLAEILEATEAAKAEKMAISLKDLAILKSGAPTRQS